MKSLRMRLVAYSLVAVILGMIVISLPVVVVYYSPVVAQRGTTSSLTNQKEPSQLNQTTYAPAINRTKSVANLTNVIVNLWSGNYSVVTESRQDGVFGEASTVIELRPAPRAYEILGVGLVFAFAVFIVSRYYVRERARFG